MSKKANLDSGFLLLYDWLPAFENLPAKEVKTLLLALVARQREGKAFPIFKNPLTESYARMIEPCIKRRLDGALAAKKAESGAFQSGDGGGEGGTPASKEEINKEELKKAHFQKKRTPPTGGTGAPATFDIEDFFNAAIAATYGEDSPAPIKN